MFIDENKLVSIIILSYQSRATISRALHSVFVQDYPRLEIIVSDDCSDDFSQEYVNEEFSSYAGKNIERFLIITNDENRGTVANLWRALEELNGEYFAILGADDAYACQSVISDFMKTFAYRNWRPLLVTGLMEMWSQDMNTLLRTIPEGCARSALQSEDPQKLFEILSFNCAIPILATCFHKSFIDAVDAFSRSYRYYEDYPTFLKMTRKGIAPAYVDKVMVRHAAGGIANGNTNGSMELTRGLYRDRVRMWRNEFDPYSGQLGTTFKKKNADRRLGEKKNYYQAKRGNRSEKYIAASKTWHSIKKFYSTKAIHRAVLSSRFFIVIMLMNVGIMCAFQEWNVLNVIISLACVPILLSLLWFSGLCFFQLLKKVNAKIR